MLGFDGKSLIHPSTIDITNKIYTPSDEVIEIISFKEVEKAQKIVDIYSKSEK